MLANYDGKIVFFAFPHKWNVSPPNYFTDVFYVTSPLIPHRGNPTPQQGQKRISLVTLCLYPSVFTHTTYFSREWIRNEANKQLCAHIQVRLRDVGNFRCTAGHMRSQTAYWLTALLADTDLINDSGIPVNGFPLGQYQYMTVFRKCKVELSRTFATKFRVVS